MSDPNEDHGPDLSQGIPSTQLADGKMIAGQFQGDDVLLVRKGKELFAIGAHCSHYHGPLADGLLAGETVRCPWHHACFSLRSGEAVRAPAIDPLSRWRVEERDGKIRVLGKLQPESKFQTVESLDRPDRIVIVGGGAAGFAAAEMLRRRDFQGGIVMLSSDDSPPVDRPNLSKDYLAGTAPEDWVPLKPAAFYDENAIELRLEAQVTGIDVRARKVMLAGGAEVPYDKLLLATGAEPVRLQIPGADQGHVHLLRSLSDSRALIRAAEQGKRAVVVGASFIGLEVAASLRKRGIEVHVVAPETIPMARVMGSELGAFVKSLHQENGVIFHLENSVTEILRDHVVLKDGKRLDADFVCVGIGVRPRLALAEQAGLAIDRGVLVDEFLQTGAPGVFAAGDIARWPDPHSGEKIRVEHWAVAERQGQAAALNMLGAREKFTAVPFFWSQHYDVPINYVGHAEKWDDIAIEGDIAKKDCVVKFNRSGRALAVASIFRDIDSLRAELEMENAATA